MAFSAPKGFGSGDLANPWAAAGIPGATDFNRLEGNIMDLHLRAGNLSFEYMSNGADFDGWLWSATSGTISQDAAQAVEGKYSAKIANPGGGAGVGGGGQLTNLGYFPIQEFVNYYYWRFAIWGTAAMRNDLSVVFYDGSFNPLSTVSIYSSTSNYTTKTLFLCQMPAIPAGAQWCRLLFYGGNPATATGGTVYFDAIDFFNSYMPAIGQVGTAPTFIEVSKTGDHNYTTAAILPIATAGGFKLGYFPGTVSLDVQSHMNAGSTGGYLRLKIGSLVGTDTFVANASYAVSTLTLTMDSSMIAPMSIEVQYRLAGADTLFVKRTATAATFTPAARW